MSQNDKKLLGVFIGGGVLLGLAYWLYLKISDPDNAPSFNDLFSTAQSYFSRGYYVANGEIQKLLGSLGGSSDPRAIALGLIAQLEGFSPKPYADPPGQTQTYSIGYGHQIVAGDGFDMSSEISESDARALLNSDLDTYVSCVNGAVTYQTLTANQYAALYSFCYNEGCSAFTGSTMLSDINSGDLGSASGEFDRWVYAGGQVLQALVDRRNAEQALFSTDLTATS